MTTYINHIETLVPEQEYQQDFTRDLIKKNVVSSHRATQSIIHRVYSQSGIKKRHSVIRDFSLNGEAPLFFDEEGWTLPTPSTQTRNEVYTRYAKKYFCDLARNTVENADGFSTNDITHVITVSCTGFFAPGPEFHIVKELNLPSHTQRYHLGFMGCFAAITALKMADAFCKADPNAVVLVVSLELCTIHLKFQADVDSIISGSVFADGGSAAIVSSKNPGGSQTALELVGFRNDITPKGEGDMAWTIGDAGFDMVLSTYVPDIIEENIAGAIQKVVQQLGTSYADIDHWAIHPGGRAILDRIQNALHLQDDQLLPSRNVLANYGNMSSATILFVLQEMLQHSEIQDSDQILGMAFGPGLSIESALFRCLTA